MVVGGVAAGGKNGERKKENIGSKTLRRRFYVRREMIEMHNIYPYRIIFFSRVIRAYSYTYHNILFLLLSYHYKFGTILCKRVLVCFFMPLEK